MTFKAMKQDPRTWEKSVDGEEKGLDTGSQGPQRFEVREEAPVLPLSGADSSLSPGQTHPCARGEVERRADTNVTVQGAPGPPGAQPRSPYVISWEHGGGMHSDAWRMTRLGFRGWGGGC